LKTAECPTFRGSWYITHRPLPTYQISLKSKKHSVDGWTAGRTFETHFIRSTRRSWPKNGNYTSQRVILAVNFWRSVIIAELWRPEVARHQKFSDFLLRRVFIVSQIDVLCAYFVKFGRLKSVKSCVIYLIKKTTFRLALQLSLLLGSRPKSARASPQQCTKSAPGFIQICSFSAEL